MQTLISQQCQWGIQYTAAPLWRERGSQILGIFSLLGVNCTNRIGQTPEDSHQGSKNVFPTKPDWPPVCCRPGIDPGLPGDRPRTRPPLRAAVRGPTLEESPFEFQSNLPEFRNFIPSQYPKSNITESATGSPTTLSRRWRSLSGARGRWGSGSTRRSVGYSAWLAGSFSFVMKTLFVYFVFSHQLILPSCILHVQR